MSDKKSAQMDRIMRYARLIEKQAGRAVRPFRADGYVNLLNRYGTEKDASERYQFRAEPVIPDDMLTVHYESNGLFAKIIDTPAEEAIKHGFTLEDLADQAIEDFYVEALEELDWEETAMTAIKWARLFGGSIAVMLINDGRGLEEPLDWRHIKSIDDIRVYERSVVNPDYASMFSYDPRDPFRTRGSRLGMPEYYHVSSRSGTFTVHDSRVLVFQNGILPENTTNSIYQLWGIPEFIRINRAIRDAEIAHGTAPKLLDRSIQAVYKMKDLSSELSTEDGESRVLRRLQTIDTARGLLNSIVIDGDGEDYDFRTFQFSGVSDVIDSSCNFLSALTCIPQTILFGRSPAGMNATGESDMENYYNFIERIERRMVKKNLRYLLSVIFQAGVTTGEIDEVPKIKIKFNPLWSLSESEQADLDQKKAQTQQTKAQTAQIYCDMQAIDPSEVRRKLADSEDFDVENMLDEIDGDEDLFPTQEEMELAAAIDMATEIGELEPSADPLRAVDPGTTGKLPQQGDLAAYSQGVSVEEHEGDPGDEGAAPAAAPTATKLPQDMSEEERREVGANLAQGDSNDELEPYSVGVLVVSDGKILSGTRHNDFGYGLVCGPGGHGEPGETPVQTAFRETEEEFGISPKELLHLGRGPKEPDTGLTPYLFLCTSYEGEPNCLDLEISNAKFRTIEELNELAASMFQPFADGLDILMKCIDASIFYDDEGHQLSDHLKESLAGAMRKSTENKDGGPGSGNFGHEGVPGQVGGSAPTGKGLNEKILSALNEGRSEFDRTAREVVESVPVGTKFEQFGVTYEKTEEGKWKGTEGEEFDDDGMAKFAFSYLGGERYLPKFQDPTSEDIAEAKIAAGELDPEDTSVVNSASAIAKYQDYGYKAVNEALRKGEALEGNAAYIDEGLQKAFSEAEPLPARMTVERDSGMAVTAEAFEKADNPVLRRTMSGSLMEAWRNPEIRKAIEDTLIGYEFEDKGYTSTSSDHKAFADFANGNGGEDYFSSFGCKETMAIGIPQGSKVLDLGDSGFIAGSGEHEVILNKGGHYTIRDVDYDYETQSLRLYCDYKGGERSDGGTPTNLPDIILRRMQKSGNFPENNFGKSEESAVIKSRQLSVDGGPGSGNHNHEGRPGEVGGSLPSGKQLTERVKDAYNYKEKGLDYGHVGREFRAALKDMPVGAKVTLNGTAFEKIGEDSFSYEWREGQLSTANTNMVVNNTDPFDPSKAPVFEEIKSENVAEAKLETGELKPEETSVEVPAYKGEPYKGSMVDVDADQFDGLRKEIQDSTGKAVSNEEVKEYLSAVDEFRGTDYTDVVAASAGFSGPYEDYSSFMTESQKEAAAASAEKMEQLIQNAEKYNGTVKRAMAFDIGGDLDVHTSDDLAALLGACKVGSKIGMGHLSSWTTDDNTITQVLSARSGVDESAEETVQVVFTCWNSSSGVDIGRFSKSFTQGEVAFSKNQQFVVKSVSRSTTRDGYTMYDIEVEESKGSRGRGDGGPGSGNFGHKGVPGQLGGSAHNPNSRETVSRSIVSKEKAISGMKSAAEAIAESHPGIVKGTDITKAYLDAIGYTGLPVLRSPEEFEATESDYPTVYRGVETDEQYDQFLNGEAFIGKGDLGNGSNATAQAKEAEYYATEGGKVIKMKLAPGAKVIPKDDLVEAIREFRASPPTASSDKASEILRAMTSDPACYAAALGYDAISGWDDWYNVINRTAAIVESEEA